jgi:hypothetical protein
MYLVIADNEVKSVSTSHEQAQASAKAHSNGRYSQAKVIYLPNHTVQGVWFKGERVS